MTANTVNGGGAGARSGAQTLLLLATPPNAAILEALAAGAAGQAELRQATRLPSQATLRAQLKRLVAAWAIEKRRRNRFPGVLEYELTPAGRELLFVAGVLERWLGEAPDGPLPLGTDAARAAVKALAEGWSATMLRALAAGLLGLGELAETVGSLSYPSVERRLAAMRLAGQVEPCGQNGRNGGNTVSDWLRRAAAPLLAASCWEGRQGREGTAPVARLDIETIFLLALPATLLPQPISGCCRLAARIPNGRGPDLAGVQIVASRGEVASVSTRLRGDPDTWALGSLQTWHAALVEGDAEELELGGDHDLARALVGGLQGVLCG